VIAAEAVYILYAGLSTQPYISILWSILAFTAAIGLWALQRWSQYLVYLLSAMVLFSWSWGFWYSLQQHSWPYERLSASLVGLLFISLCPVGLATGASIVVFKFFRARSPSAPAERPQQRNAL
jgi:hypothetical protein